MKRIYPLKMLVNSGWRIKKKTSKITVLEKGNMDLKFGATKSGKNMAQLILKHPTMEGQFLYNEKFLTADENNMLISEGWNSMVDSIRMVEKKYSGVRR
jgi:hypothetical protein